jgi:beta-galactosidase beta subunit
MVPAKRRFVTIPSRNGKNNPYIVPEDQIFFIEFTEQTIWGTDGRISGTKVYATVHLLSKGKEVLLNTSVEIDEAKQILGMLS